MFGMPMLDVMMGMMFVYLLLAFVCTAINELIAGWLDSREKHLQLGIANLLGEHAGAAGTRVALPYHDPQSGEALHNSMVQAFYAHPLIKALGEDGTRPSYIPPATFSQVVLDLLAPADGKTPKSIQSIVSGIETSLGANPDLRRTLLVLVEDAADIAQLRSALETWFNNGMERVSAWYKRQSQRALFFISLAVCLLMNADSITIAKDLYKNPAQRTAIVTQAEQMMKTAAAPREEATDNALTGDQAAALAKTLGQLHATGLSWGWGKEWRDLDGFGLLVKLLGILLTAIAASLGAPFWFDLLKKVITIRAVGKPPAESGATAPAAPVARPVVAGPEGSVG